VEKIAYCREKIFSKYSKPEIQAREKENQE
jgi:hypothetical protein